MNKIAIVFDFDDTLAPDSTSAYLEYMGLDVQDFWKRKVQELLEDDWDPVPAYLYKMIKESDQVLKNKSFTKESMIKFASRINFHKGVNTIFTRLRSYVEKNYPEIELEFYLISSGIGEILRHTKIAKYFTDIWASDFVYDKEGKIAFPKKIVSFTDKTRYLFHISKGLVGKKFRGRPFDVNKKVDPEKLRVKMDRMIFVGDGYTDIPCFSMLRKSGGFAFGVYDKHAREKWGRAWGFIEEGRVSNLHSADFSKDSDLSNSLMMAIESIVNRIRLNAALYQG